MNIPNPLLLDPPLGSEWMLARVSFSSFCRIDSRVVCSLLRTKPSCSSFSPQRKGFSTHRNRIATAIVAPSTAFFHNGQNVNKTSTFVSAMAKLIYWEKAKQHKKCREFYVGLQASHVNLNTPAQTGVP
ncbi:hypothetical protein E2542_SST04829 [Spatholobus suberectus]|nr:hypothetical protein E2542_SST04829 [Spatholobus suberectus]